MDAAYDGSTVLLTGATGFLGKVVLEKILYSLRGVSKIFVLLRPRGTVKPEGRLASEVLCWACFDRVKASRPDFRAVIQVIGGDVSQDDLGCDPQALAMLQAETDWIINCAANVEFMEPLQKIVMDNVKSALTVLKFAQGCKRLRGLVHVSTAYVNANNPGQVQEKIYSQWYYDNAEELYEWVMSSESDTIQRVLPNLLAGMPNTYTFSKQLAEILLSKKRGDISLAIVRPTCVGASYREPMPGWIDKVGAGATLFLASGLGHLSILQGDANLAGDQIPVDMVTNVILTAVLRLQSEPNMLHIFHSSSSTRNAITWGFARTIVYKYFGSPGRQAAKSVGHNYTYIVPPSTFKATFFMTYHLPALLYGTLGRAVSLVAGQENKLVKDSKKTRYLVKRLRKLTLAFAPFTSREFRFECSGIDRLVDLMSPEDRECFSIEVEDVDWEKYMYDFCWGLQHFILKEDVPPWDMKNTLTVPKHFGADFQFCLSGGPTGTTPRFSPPPTGESIISCPVLRAEVEAAAVARSVPAESLYGKLQKWHKQMAAQQKLSTIRLFAYVFPKIYRKMYDDIQVGQNGVDRVRAAVAKGPVIFLPNHRSYIDFLIISYITFANRLDSPHIAAGEVFLKMGPITALFRGAGAFFIMRRSDDPLYRVLLERYVADVIKAHPMLEFFLEGTRSRSGKSLTPKYGMIGMVTGAVLRGEIPNARIVPVTLNYEKVLEIDAIVTEQMGQPKKMESFSGAVTGGIRTLKQNFGSVKVCFGEEISIQRFRKNLEDEKNDDSFDPVKNLKDHQAFDRALAMEVIGQIHHELEVSPTALVATLVLENPKGVLWFRLTRQLAWLSAQVQQRKGRLIYPKLPSADAASKGVKLLGSHVQWNEERGEVQALHEPIASDADAGNQLIDRKTALMLGYYRNTLIHLFAVESVGIAAFAAFGRQQAVESGVPLAALEKRIVMLRSVFEHEFVAVPKNPADVVSAMITHGSASLLGDSGTAATLVVGSPRVVSLLANTIAPFLECYWFLGVQLPELVPVASGNASDEWLKISEFILRILAAARAALDTDELQYSQSFSADMINNALRVLKGLGHLEIKGGKVRICSNEAATQIVAWAVELEPCKAGLGLEALCEEEKKAQDQIMEPPQTTHEGADGFAEDDSSGRMRGRRGSVSVSKLLAQHWFWKFRGRIVTGAVVIFVLARLGFFARAIRLARLLPSQPMLGLLSLVYTRIVGTPVAKLP